MPLLGHFSPLPETPQNPGSAFQHPVQVSTSRLQVLLECKFTNLVITTYPPSPPLVGSKPILPLASEREVLIWPGLDVRHRGPHPVGQAPAVSTMPMAPKHGEMQNTASEVEPGAKCYCQTGTQLCAAPCNCGQRPNLDSFLALRP